MRCGRNLLTTMIFAAAIILIGTRDSMAQQHAPDPTMLLNLDLFAAQGNAANQPGTSDSMLSQIRALRAMGYLNGPSVTTSQPAALPAPPPAPAPLPESQTGIME
jgi:hypothetical protein